MLSPQTVTINSDTTRESLTASPSFLNGQQGILIYCLLTNITATYSTVPIITEYLWWQWIALCGLPILRNIFIHPLSFLLWHCDIHFFKLYAIGFQKPHHILLPLLYLDERKKKKRKKKQYSEQVHHNPDMLMNLRTLLLFGSTFMGWEVTDSGRLQF